MEAASSEAQHAELGDLVEALLRAQFIAQNWAKADIRSRSETRIAFPDYRIINYFTFLPGSRLVLVYDMHNIISCWTVTGMQLEAYRVETGAKLTRWKPLEDEIASGFSSESTIWTVEIMLEHVE